MAEQCSLSASCPRLDMTEAQTQEGLKCLPTGPEDVYSIQVSLYYRVISNKRLNLTTDQYGW